MRRRWIAILAAGLVLAGRGQVPGAAPDPAAVQALSNRIAELELAIRQERDGAQRRRLQDELELVRHQLGPRTSSGRRVHPHAMWHDAAMESLAEEVERLARPASQPTVGPVAHGKAYVRRAAAACLDHGWGLPDTRVKYQVNMFGQYLAANLETTDRMFEAFVPYLVRESKSESGDAERETLGGFLDRFREAVERMEAPVKVLEGQSLPGATEDEATRPLRPLAKALADAYEALEAIRRWEAARGEAETPGAEAAVAETEPPPMTDAERRALAAVREAVGALDGSDWAAVRRMLKRYASAIANGFDVPAARAKAREFLGHLERAAALAASLHDSDAAYPDYRAEHLKRLEGALRRMESPLDRDYGYRLLSRLWRNDAFRRQVDAGGLSPAGARGVLYARLVVWPEMRNAADVAALEMAPRLRQACHAIARVCERLGGEWPPKGMTGRLPDFFRRQVATFRRAAGAAGAHFPGDKATGVPAMLDAGERARDVERIVRADRAIRDVRKYVPKRATPMYVQLGLAVKDMVEAKDLGGARSRLERLIRPFEGLGRFPLPDARHGRAAMGLLGRSYTKARSTFSREVALGIHAASNGDPTPLNQALEARWLFGLLRHRAIARTGRLERVGVENLAPLALPEGPLARFVVLLDKDLQSRFATYARAGRQSHGWMRRPEAWDAAYHLVVAAQRQTADARREGESDMAFLLRNLERVAAPGPSWPTWSTWAAGYHLLETAVSMNAGAGAAANWHRAEMNRYGWHLRRIDLE